MACDRQARPDSSICILKIMLCLELKVGQGTRELLSFCLNQQTLAEQKNPGMNYLFRN